MLARAEQLGGEGNVDEAQQLLENVEKTRALKKEAEVRSWSCFVQLAHLQYINLSVFETHNPNIVLFLDWVVHPQNKNMTTMCFCSLISDTRMTCVALLVASSFFCLSFTVSCLVVTIGRVQELNASIQLPATEAPGV